MRKLFGLVVLAVLVLASGCPEGGLFGVGCGEIRFRCNSNRMELCNADGNWELFRDCGSVGEVCTTVPSRCGGYAGPCCDQ